MINQLILSQVEIQQAVIDYIMKPENKPRYDLLRTSKITLQFEADEDGVQCVISEKQ